MNYRLIIPNFFHFLVLMVCLNYFHGHAQDDKRNKYIKYVDLASANTQDHPEIAQLYLDSIPKPVENYLKGNLADYYYTLSTLNNRLDNQNLIYKNLLLAVKYAELEKKYKIAGASYLELFYNVYVVKKDSSAFEYLAKAEYYFDLINDKHGLADVKQMHTYSEHLNNNFAESNRLLLENLDYYQLIQDDSYYYMYALFLISLNAINLDDLETAHNYIFKLKQTKNDPTISEWLHNIHMVTLNGKLAEFHLNKQNLDSTYFYLSEAKKMKPIMNKSDIERYFKVSINFYKKKGNIDKVNKYIDSLKLFQEQVLNENLKASYEISEDILDSASNLEAQKKKVNKNRNLFILALIGLLIITIVLIVKNKKVKSIIGEYTKRDEDFDLLQESHEKLQAKTKGLESLIEETKKRIKNVSAIGEKDLQQKEIKELYKNIHQNFSTLQERGIEPYQLVNKLNVRFFNELNKKHPELNKSDAMVCYYLFVGFKNKEIATFMNTSIRAIEGKRYRIGKKIEISNKSSSLYNYLKSTFKDFS